MAISDTNPNTDAIINGSLFHGSFYKYGGFIASIVLRKSKLSPFIPIFSSMFGMAIGICFGGLSALIIAAIYRSAWFLLPWHYGIVWGIGLSVLHFILAFTLKLFQV
ncbi:transmembrane protein [Cavenderia fasciculata]|uniref:Transmembrane protein n=1 Tax=Cavenderia fasciculata TaxID=261658 RepID=F4PQ32_CACFS|nr:uncharacterized protein DFA_04623 [Cavenderia fasciculata]EGG22495.1 transmembrane protein [Cavenderia fasciculata]|eukprot:XP_004360346.1 transmembrane protein [Cavenderia fasciculata]